VWDEPGFEWQSEGKGGRGPINEESIRVSYLDGEVGPGVEKRVVVDRSTKRACACVFLT